MERCEDCGFEYDELPVEQIGRAIRAMLPQYGTILALDPAALRAHPIPGTWSALEYACHLRDVFEVQHARVELALAEDEPVFEPMGREERVTADHYNDQDPVVVEQQLIIAGRALADLFDSLEPAQWERTAIYNYPTPASRTIAWIGRHTVHEGRHHLRDMERVLDALNPP
ncbi:MAG: hypothetical protein JWL83_4886 [Actinomycetia bacterium]|nr:hypothetical protein [Actinomycetes bacterium]